MEVKDDPYQSVSLWLRLGLEDNSQASYRYFARSYRISSCIKPHQYG